LTTTRLLSRWKFVAQAQISWINSFAIPEASARDTYKRRDTIRLSLRTTDLQIDAIPCWTRTGHGRVQKPCPWDLAQNSLRIKDL